MFLLKLFTGGVGGLQNMMRQFQQGAAGNFGGLALFPGSFVGARGEPGNEVIQPLVALLLTMLPIYISELYVCTSESLVSVIQ